MNSQLSPEPRPEHGSPRSTAHQYPQVLAAAHHCIHHAIKGGAETLAPELGITPATLSNQANPKQSGHKLGLLDTLYIQQRTGCHDILLQSAAVLGYSLVPMGDFFGLSDMELLSAYSEWHAELGDVNRAVSQALADGHLDKAEFKRIEREYLEAVAAGQAFIARCRALVVQD